MKIKELVNSITDVSNQDKMKRLLLSDSRKQRLDVGHVFDLKAFWINNMMNRPKDEQNSVEPAFDELVLDGFFEKKDEKYYLTQKGVDSIYK